MTCNTLRLNSAAALVVGWFAAAGTAAAQHTEGCPIAQTDYGVEVERTFTDSMGRSAQIFFQLPPGHDPSVPTGILMYFHGNNHDPDDSYVAPLYELQDRADAHGLIAAGLKSIGTRMNSDGTVSREWLNTDSQLLKELLHSDFGGCFKLDRTRVYLEGESQGTCFLAAALSVWLWRDFQGGVLGLCGCWGTGEYDYPVSAPALRSRFKVFVENTTEDFLHDYGVIGLDLYKYNFGLEVRTDLDRAGMHCADSRANAAAALDWMIDGKNFADADADQPHWQVLDTRHNGLEDVAYDASGARFVIATERADISDEVREQIEDVRESMFAADPPGFLEWRLANYPEYKTPPVLVLTTADYGATFTQIARRDNAGQDNLSDMVLAPDGSILVAVGAVGLLKVNAATKTLDAFAFDGKLIYGLDRDDSGNLFAHGAVTHVQRSADSGASWTELSVPVRNQHADWVVAYGGGYLAVIGDDGMVRYSQDAGEHFDVAALPAGTPRDFAVHGQTFYAVMDDSTLQISKNAGATWQAASLPNYGARAVEVLPNGDALVGLDPVQIDIGLTYRSKDQGQSWERERGAHNDARMELAIGKGDEAMMVTTRGILRYSTGAPLDLGTPPPPITMTSGNAMDGGAAGSTSGAGGSGASAGTGATGGTPAGTMPDGGAAASTGGSQGNVPPSARGEDLGNDSTDDRGDGCGCRLSTRRPSTASVLALLAVSALCARRSRSRRRRSDRQPLSP